MQKVIGLVDVDSHNFPNLALMKISAWFKKKGYETELLKTADVLKGTSLFTKYKLPFYGACVFDWNRELCDKLGKLNTIVGGTGSGKTATLPKHIEHIYPDYSLYGITDTAYGFMTRGCPRHCPFCIVGDKEGLRSRKVADLSEFWEGQKNIEILDPNILACDEHMDLLEQVAKSGALVNFNQGLDCRFLDDDNVAILKKIRMRRLHFAWDNPKDINVPKKLEYFASVYDIKPRSRKCMVYVLVNYWSTFQEDLERIYWLRDMGYAPYVMIYDKPNAPREIRLLQRWVNNRYVFYSTKTFEEFNCKKA